MKSILVACLFVFAAGSQAVGEEYIVKFRNPPGEKSLQLLNSTDAQVTGTMPQLNMIVVKSAALHSDGLKALSSDIEYVVKNGTVRISKTPLAQSSDWSKESDLLWGMEAIKLKGAWAVTQGDRSIIVAVSDTGTYLKHRDLKDNIWINPGESGKDDQGRDKSKNGVDDDGNGFIDDINGYNFETNTPTPTDNHYHGTHVAGTIGATGGNGGIVGVSGKVSIMTVKFLGADGSGTDDKAVKTILYAADNGAKVINCSWGGDEYSQPIYDAIVYAQQKGVLVVVAAGNDGIDHDKKPSYPSGFTLDNMITVGATDSKNGHLAYFSNYGAKSVHIAAPGYAISSTFNLMYPTLHCGDGSGGTVHFYCEFSGTSMATPHVAGAAAMIYAANPKLNYHEVRDIILSTAAPSSKLTGKVLTGGQLDVAAAVKKAASLRR